MLLLLGLCLPMSANRLIWIENFGSGFAKKWFGSQASFIFGLPNTPNSVQANEDTYSTYLCKKTELYFFYPPGEKNN